MCDVCECARFESLCRRKKLINSTVCSIEVVDLTVSDMVNMTDETNLEQKFLVKCVADAF